MAARKLKKGFVVLYLNKPKLKQIKDEKAENYINSY